MAEWAESEFGAASLGDKRLTLRLVKLSTRFAEQPTASIPCACGGAAETKAAYRFFDQANEDRRQLGWEAILRPHMDSMVERMRAHPVVLCLRDTTELNFNGQSIEGLGPLSYDAQRGMYVHPTYVVTPQREPLGVIDAWMWVREPEAADGTRPGICESLRWIEGYERVAESAASLPDTRLVYVADREADILALMQCAHAMGNPADWLIRARHNRCLPEGGKLWAATCAQDPLGEIEFTLASRHGQAERTVRQRLWAHAVDLPAGLRATCVIAREVDAPAGIKPLELRLLTNRPVATLEAAVELIDWYRCRWEIVTLFHVLKNGCRVEALQLDSIAKLELALALYLVVSWRIAHLVRIGRVHPNLPTDLYFDQTE